MPLFEHNNWFIMFHWNGWQDPTISVQIHLGQRWIPQNFKKTNWLTDWASNNKNKRLITTDLMPLDIYWVCARVMLLSKQFRFPLFPPMPIGVVMFLLLFKFLLVRFPFSLHTVMMDEPRFAQPIPNVTVAVGRDANLPCVVEHLSGYKVSSYYF